MRRNQTTRWTGWARARFSTSSDPDALAAEFAARGVRFSVPLGDNDDGLRGFVIEDLDGYGLYFGHLRA